MSDQPSLDDVSSGRVPLPRDPGAEAEEARRRRALKPRVPLGTKGK